MSGRFDRSFYLRELRDFRSRTQRGRATTKELPRNPKSQTRKSQTPINNIGMPRYTGQNVQRSTNPKLQILSSAAGRVYFARESPKRRPAGPWWFDASARKRMRLRFLLPLQPLEIFRQKLRHFFEAIDVLRIDLHECAMGIKTCAGYLFL